MTTTLQMVRQGLINPLRKALKLNWVQARSSLRQIPSFRTAVTALLVGTMLTACYGRSTGESSTGGSSTAGSSTGRTLSSLTVTSNSANLLLNALDTTKSTTSVAVTGAYSDGTAAPTGTISYTSSNPSIATISTSGVITAVAAGTTSITATSGSVTSSALPITVLAPTAISASLASNANQKPGAAQAISVTGTYANGSVVPVLGWTTSSGNNNIATTSSDGNTGTGSVVAGTTWGSAIITVTLGNLTSTVTEHVGPSTFTLAFSNPIVFYGNPVITTTITPTVTYSDGSVVPTTGITYLSSNTSVATIANNVATAVQTGTTSITASLGGLTSTAATWTVSPPNFIDGYSQLTNDGDINTVSVNSQGTVTLYSTYLPADISDFYSLDQDSYSTLAASDMRLGATADLGRTAISTGAKLTTSATTQLFISNFRGLTINAYANSGWANPKIVIKIGTNATVTNANCNPTVATVLAITSTATSYNIPWSAFTNVIDNCGTSGLTAANVLAGVMTTFYLEVDGGTYAVTANGLTSNYSSDGASGADHSDITLTGPIKLY